MDGSRRGMMVHEARQVSQGATPRPVERFLAIPQLAPLAAASDECVEREAGGGSLRLDTDLCLCLRRHTLECFSGVVYRFS